MENKEKAKELLEKIKEFLEKRLNLQLNKKTTYMPIKQGCIFCGYRVYLDHRLIKRANINRVKKRIKKWNQTWESGNYDFQTWNQSFNAWKGYAKHANSYKLINSLEKKMDYLYENSLKLK